MKEGYGIIVGRFQVNQLHEGHLELLNAVRHAHPRRTIVFLGVSPTLGTGRNPLDFVTRKLMLQRAFDDITILPMPDMATDEAWSAELDKRIREAAQYGAVTLYGGRDSFVPHYTGAFKPCELPLESKISGEALRLEVSNTVMSSPDFRAGVIYSTQNRFPLVLPCVDIAIFNHDRTELLLARKANEVKYRFVGGHADPDGTTFEHDAVREVREETGLELVGLHYIGSTQINDWRYGKEVDKIKTLLFAGYAVSEGAIPKDDIVEVKWFRTHSVSESLIVPAHRPLFALLRCSNTWRVSYEFHSQN